MNFSSTTGSESFNQRWKYCGQDLEIYGNWGHIRKLNHHFIQPLKITLHSFLSQLFDHFACKLYKRMFGILS